MPPIRRAERLRRDEPGLGPKWRISRAGPLCLVFLGMTSCADAGVVEPVPAPSSDARFDVEIRYWGEPPAADRRARIELAARVWENVIVGPLEDASVKGDIGCGPGSPRLDEVVDDLVVYVRVADLDGLAEAGPCLVRATSGLPITGTVWIDRDRVYAGSPGALEALVAHEVGHVLGFGTLWGDRGLLADASLQGGSDPHFTGADAVHEFDIAGGGPYSGAKVPVEDRGGGGTADSHWRAAVFGERELMVAFVPYGRALLSRITVAAMGHLGYEVDLDAADSYFLPGQSPLGPAIVPARDRRLRDALRPP